MQPVNRSVVSIFELEPLEIRQLLTTASVNSSHVLVITGTSNNDTIIVNKLSNGKVSVSGVSTQFSPGSSSGKFNQISVNAGNGNDLVQINNNVPYNSSTISGSNGNDTLTGGKGNDSIDGDNDNDTLDGGGGGADLLRGDSGEDLANYSDRTDNLNITLDGVANDGAPGEKDNVQCEEVIAGSGNDTLIGSSGDDVLNGGAGADFIQGGGGNDVITGSTGSDTLEGQQGSDYLQAKNQDLDQVSGGTDPGGTDVDLASVDPQDIPVPGIGSDAKPAAAPASVADSSGNADLDPTYGTNGLGYGPDLGWNSVNASAVDSQGRVVFVGTLSVNDGDDTDMVVARFTADGQLDSSFGINGQLDINFTPSSDETDYDDSTGNGVTIGANDEIIVVGSVIRNSQGRTDTDFAVAEITSDGQLDSNFGDNGTFSADLPNLQTGDSNDTAYGAAVDSNGNVYVVGDRQYAGEGGTYDLVSDFDANNNPSQIGPWMYGSSNSLYDSVTPYDQSVDEGGITVWKNSTLQSALSDAPDLAYNPDDGDATVSLSPGFYGQYSNAVFTAPSSGEYEVNGSFIADQEGDDADVHILVSNQSNLEDGALDSENTEYDFDDFVHLYAGDTVTFSVGYGADQNFTYDQTDLSATVTQISFDNSNTIAVAKVLSDGTGLDTSWANGYGFNATDFTGDSDQEGLAIALTNDSSPQAVIGGEIDGQNLVAKFTADGTSLDYSFNDGYGYTTDDGSSNYGVVNAIAIDSNNDIYAVGADENSIVSAAKPASQTASPAEVAVEGDEADVVEYGSDGTVLNSTFNDNHDGSMFNGVYIDSQGRIIAAGSAEDDDQTGENYLVSRFDSSLNPDTDFNDVTTDFPEPTSGDDVAFGVRELDDGSIVTGGYSANGSDEVFSAAKYIPPAPPQTGQIPDIEEYVTDADLKNPPPELQQLLNGLSTTSLQFVFGEPDDNGNATINTGDGNDLVTLTTVRGADGEEVVAVDVNGVTTFYDPTTTKHLYINTGGGNDTIKADNSVDVELYIDAGDGNDSVQGGGDESVILGGAGNDTLSLGSDAGVLVGGSGNDKLTGSDHFDILIGGTGKDSLNGGKGEDIMIGGTTSYDTDFTALRALLEEWHSGDNRSTRISDIENGGGKNGAYVLRAKGLSNQTVFDDGSVDTLDGGADADWFFRHTGSNADILKNSTGDFIQSV